MLPKSAKSHFGFLHPFVRFTRGAPQYHDGIIRVLHQYHLSIVQISIEKCKSQTPRAGSSEWQSCKPCANLQLQLKHVRSTSTLLYFYQARIALMFCTQLLLLFYSLFLRRQSIPSFAIVFQIVGFPPCCVMKFESSRTLPLSTEHCEMLPLPLADFFCTLLLF